MSMIQLQPNTRFNFKGHTGRIRCLSENAVQLIFLDREPIVISSEQLQAWVASRDIELLSFKKVRRSKTLKLEQDPSRERFIQLCINEMARHHTPLSRSFVRNVINDITKKIGFPNKPISDSTIIVRYRKWVLSDRSFK